MNVSHIASTLAAAVALGSLASAQFTTTGPFTGTAGTEGFETQDTSGGPFPTCVEDRVFTDTADLCSWNSSAHITGSWGFGCSIYPHSGNRLFGTTGSTAEYMFDDYATKFGGYFGTNNPSAADGTIRFYDDVGTLLHSDVITAPNDCTWTWNGWDFGGVMVKSIEIDSNYSSGGFMDMDDMEADTSSGAPLGTQYCPGSGAIQACPCANGNNGSMGGCDWGDTNFPEGGVLDGSGSASVAMGNAYLNATGVSDDFGVFFGADNAINSGNGSPLNDGLRCAGGALIRLNPPTVAAGNQMTTSASLTVLDTGAVAGATRRYQYWFRTPNGPCGGQANLTNGYEIVWMP